MGNVLYINACVRGESRTNRLAQRLLSHLGPYKEVKLDEEGVKPMNEERLLERSRLIDEKDFSSPIFRYARDFQEADTIVISAPFWDLSFPSLLKVYIENIYVTGLVSEYGTDGVPKGLCKASKLYYVTTAGAQFEPKYSYEYMEDLALHYFGIKETQLIKAEMLDIDGVDAELVMQTACDEIDQMFR